MSDPFSPYPSGSIEYLPGYNPQDTDPLNWGRLRQFLAGVYRLAAGSVGPRELMPGLAGIPSVAALKATATATLPSGHVVHLLGYYDPGDGGGAFVRWDPASTATADDVTVFAPTVGSGRWISMVSGSVSVRQAGARGNDLDDDTAAFNRAVSVALVRNLVVTVPPGTYRLSDDVNATLGRGQNLTIVGIGRPLVRFTVLNKRFFVSGASVYEGTLQTAATYDSHTATCATAPAGAQVGDLFYVGSAEIIVEIHNLPRNELSRIIGVSGNTVTLEDTLVFTHSPTDSGHVVRVKTSGRFSLIGIDFAMPTASSQGFDGPVTCSNLVEPHVIDCSTTRADLNGDGFRFDQCYAPRVLAVRADGGRYNIWFRGSRRGHIQDVYARNCWAVYDLASHTIETTISGVRTIGQLAHIDHHGAIRVDVDRIHQSNDGGATSDDGYFRVIGGRLSRARFELSPTGIALGKRLTISNKTRQLVGKPTEYLIDRIHMIYDDLDIVGEAVVHAEACAIAKFINVRGPDVTLLGAQVTSNADSRVDHLVIDGCDVPNAMLQMAPRCKTVRISGTRARGVYLWGFSGLLARLAISDCTFVGAPDSLFVSEADGSYSQITFTGCFFDGTAGGTFEALSNASKTLVFVGCTFLDVSWGTLQLAQCRFDSACRFEGTTSTAGIEIDTDVPMHRAGLKVLDTRQSAVADATGGATVDAEARTALNAALAALRAHGLISS